MIIDGPLGTSWGVNMSASLLADLAAVPATPFPWTDDSVRWESPTGKILSAHKYGTTWLIYEEAQRTHNGTGGCLGSCMSSGRVRAYAREIVDANRANQQMSLF